MRVAIVVFAGTNCEYDTQYAFEKLGVEVEFVWHKDNLLPKNIDLVVLPGGFSYGDALRSGSIARFSPIISDVIKFAENGGNVLGICNGFQILLEAGLLPGAMKRNRSVHFISRYHYLQVLESDNAFLSLLKKDDILNIPIAHAEGNYYIDKDSLNELYNNGQVILKYCAEDGSDKNPNGSVDAIAGICNKEKNVFGLMPHPERAMDSILGSDDGINMLKGFL